MSSSKLKQTDFLWAAPPAGQLTAYVTSFPFTNDAALEAKVEADLILIGAGNHLQQMNLTPYDNGAGSSLVLACVHFPKAMLSNIGGKNPAPLGDTDFYFVAPPVDKLKIEATIQAYVSDAAMQGTFQTVLGSISPKACVVQTNCIRFAQGGGNRFLAYALYFDPDNILP